MRDATNIKHDDIRHILCLPVKKLYWLAWLWSKHVANGGGGGCVSSLQVFLSFFVIYLFGNADQSECLTLRTFEFKYRRHSLSLRVTKFQQSAAVHDPIISSLQLLNPLETKPVCFILGLSAYRSVNTLHLGYAKPIC